MGPRHPAARNTPQNIGCWRVQFVAAGRLLAPSLSQIQPRWERLVHLPPVAWMPTPRPINKSLFRIYYRSDFFQCQGSRQERPRRQPAAHLLPVLSEVSTRFPQHVLNRLGMLGDHRQQHPAWARPAATGPVPNCAGWPAGTQTSWRTAPG